MVKFGFMETVSIYPKQKNSIIYLGPSLLQEHLPFVFTIFLWYPIVEKVSRMGSQDTGTDKDFLPFSILVILQSMF